MGTSDRTGSVAHRFAPAAPRESHVFGSCAPGWHSAGSHEDAVEDWLSFVERRGIERVCAIFAGSGTDGHCTLSRYRERFGPANVLHVAVPDGRLVEAEVLRREVVPFLQDSFDADSPVVVHCLSGIGRTGQVLAAWLVHRRDIDPRSAIETVREMGRDPATLVERGSTSRSDLHANLAALE